MNYEELHQLVSTPEQYKEIWLEGKNSESLCILINGNIGWLMYLRFEGDTGFSTRNPSINSIRDIEFVLNNGQRDTYPENWTYELNIIIEAMQSFLSDGMLPPQLEWHDDS